MDRENSEAALLAALASATADRYRIERELGRGATSIVFLAVDAKHGRHVAIKVLGQDFGATVGHDRFRREIDVVAKLLHPNIVPLLDSGESHGVLYFVMPFVPGESLRHRLQVERQLPVGDAIRIACEVADALEYAHSRGVLHRDIKPENILLEDGHAVVSDFGLARLMETEVGTSITAWGTAVGTPLYMSPEQASGERSIDGRSDVYSLACVLYELLVGSPPFSGATPQAVLARKLVDTVPGVRAVRDSVSQQLEAVILKALARTPADRFASAGRFAVHLRAVLATPSDGSFALSPTRKSWASAAQLFGAFLVVVAAVTAWLHWRGPTATPQIARFLLNGVSNQTGDPTLGAVALLLDAGLKQSPYIQALNDGEVRSVLVAMRRTDPDATHLPDSVAREVAWRSGTPFVVSPSLEPGASVFALRVQIQSVGARPSDIPLLWAKTFSAARREGIADVVDSATAWVRRTLGEAAPTVAARSLSVRLATTASWEALDLYSRGVALSAAGKWSDALLDLKRATVIDTGFALAYARIGDVYNSFDMGSAIPYWQHALELSRSLRLAENERLSIASQLAYDTGDLQKALEGFTLWSRSYPNEYRAHFGLAQTLTDLDRGVEAVSLYRRMLARWPRQLPFTLIRMGEAFFYTSQWDSAGSVLSRLRARDDGPYWRAAYAMFEGVRRFHMHDTSGSRAMFDQMVGSDDPYFRSLGSSYVASLLAETGHPDSAISVLEQSILQDEVRLPATETTRGYLLSTKMLGLAYLKSGRGELHRCRELAERALVLTHDPRRVAAAATLLARCGDPVKARSMLALVPAELPYPLFQSARHLVLGEVMLAEGKVVPAVDEFRQAAALDRPKASREYLARALARVGDTLEARRRYDDILSRPAWRYRSHEEAVLRPGFIANVREARSALAGTSRE